MLDLKRIRHHLDDVKSSLNLRGKGDYDIDSLVNLDALRRKLLTEVETMKSNQKRISKSIPEMKKKELDIREVMDEMKKLSGDIKSVDEKVKQLDCDIKEVLLKIPNTVKDDTPIGNSDEENVEIRKIGSIRAFNFEPKAHWDLGTSLDIIDFERAGKIAGSRFNILKRQGAKLERALISFMLDLHTEEHGYEEVLTPFMVNRTAMTGTGQLPKFEDDMFHLPRKDYFLVPTAEVPVTNMYSNEILDGDDLPIYHTAYTPCFRKEAGSAGRDTRGLIRVHQFNKVELVKFTHPDESEKELMDLLNHAETVLKLLKLPYRVVRLCGGDIGFASAITYDIEVWMPSYGRFLEISSCSSFDDYQARRANIRFREKGSKKPQFVHTINGSGLAVGRTFAAILENYQNEDGSITIPEVLIPYMGNKTRIE